MQEIQRFATDDGNLHRIVMIPDTDGNIGRLTLETAHSLNPDQWVTRQHWKMCMGYLKTTAGGHVHIHSNGAEYIYRPMTTEVEVVDRLIPPPQDDNQRLDYPHHLLEFKESFSNAFRQKEYEMVNSLLCHFPIEDGMPDFDDVAEWLSGFLNKDKDSVRVQCWAERVLLHMDKIYPRNY